MLFLISILHQTTTVAHWHIATNLLFLISILHQTTTLSLLHNFSWRLFLISILHQTTTARRLMPYHGSCFLFQFYIKPQLAMHGCMAMHGCFLFQFYIKPQQEMCEWAANGRCFLFQFYIKPQRLPWRIVFRWVVSYFNSTSNHNVISEYMLSPSLFLISILHQTTTSDMRFVDCHSVMWPNERYERRMTGRGSRNDAGFVFRKSQSKIKIWSLLERETDSSVTGI